MDKHSCSIPSCLLLHLCHHALCPSQLPHHPCLVLVCGWCVRDNVIHTPLSSIGVWAKGPNVDPRCSACGQLESISHCLWECREAGSVFMMMWRNLIAHAKQFTKGRIELFDWSLITGHLQLVPKSRKLETCGYCLHRLSYGAYGRQDVLGYFQQTNNLLLNQLSYYGTHW